MKITYTDSISSEDCNKLRSSAGWPEMHPEQIETGLKNSALVVVAKDGDATVAMGRVISDGGHVAFIVDVLVLPEYQGKGIGKAMVGRIMDFVRGQLREGHAVYVDLLASKDREGFYEPFGFIRRPNEHFGGGMSQLIRRKPRSPLTPLTAPSSV